MHAFLSNLANRQTDRQTNEHGQTCTSSFVGGNYLTVHKMKIYQDSQLFYFDSELGYVTYR